MLKDTYDSFQPNINIMH